MSNSVCEICGGCACRNMGESAYRQYKKENFIKNIARVSAETTIDNAIFISDGQRRRAEMEFTFINNKLILGFNEEKSHKLIDVNNCLMLTSELNQLLPHLHEFMQEFCKIPLVIRNKKKITTQYINEGSIYMLAADNGIDIVLKLSQEPHLEHRLLVADFVNSMTNICRMSWKVVNQEAETVVMKIKPEIYIEDCVIEVPQDVFLQASKTAEIAMVEKVKEYLGETRGKIADLFCGLGTFTYPIAKLSGNEIISVDSYEPSLKGLQKALNRNQLHNVKVINRNLFKYPFDKDDLKDVKVVILDPPRAGAHEQCREIAKIPNKDKPQKIIFISCNPNTFVYDANILVNTGYKLKQVTLVDQFVYSKHQELVALLTYEAKEE